MLLQTIISLVVVITLTLVMSFLLVKLVKRINVQSKDYFEKKMVVYNDLIDEKQEHLDKIETEIKDAIDSMPSEPEAKEINNAPEGVVVINENLPKYKIEGFFEQAKRIDDKFKFNKEQAVKDFVDKKVYKENKDELLKSLLELKAKLKDENRYKYITRSQGNDWQYVASITDEKVMKFLKPYIVGNPKADINEILSYVELEIDKASPEIVVETGEKDDNFGHIYDKIKTVYNPEIYMGIRIFYQDRMYEYSLRGVM